MSTATVVPTQLEANDVIEYANTKLLPIVNGTPLALATAAMLMVILCSIKPEIENDELVDAIQQTTAFITTLVMPVGRVN